MADILPFPSLEDVIPAAAGTQPPDAAVREQALDISKSFIVEAPAGSGKTGLLIQRFLKLLADPAVVAPEQVLAITFTNKATAEMRDRVLSQLQAAERGAPRADPSSFDRLTHELASAVLERDCELGWSLLKNPSRLRIRTIDALCNEISRSLPILSGSGGRLSPVEDASALHREAARRTILQLGGEDARFNSSLRDLLLHRDGNLADCEALLSSMLGLRDQWGDLFPVASAYLEDEHLDRHVRPRLEATLKAAICHTLSQVSAAFSSELRSELTLLAEKMAHCAGYKGSASPIAGCRGQYSPPGTAAVDLERWKTLLPLLITKAGTWRKSFSCNTIGFYIEKGHSSHLKQLIQQISGTPYLLNLLMSVRMLPPAQYPEDQWQLAKSLFRVLSAAMVQLQLVFAERSECDFTEIALRARAALRDSTGVEDFSTAVGSGLQHLLVDEMQDTSSGQYELIELLTSSWDGHSQTVFLVGDPRQSIYLFRQARVERFIEALESCRIGELPLTQLRLTANFRSQGNLVADFNEDFARVFPPQSAASDLPYFHATSILPASDQAAGRVWHIFPTRDGAQGPERAQNSPTENSAKEIARIVRRWMSTPLPANRRLIRDEFGEAIPEPWRMAVLVSSRKHLEEIVSEFRLSSIPYRSTNIDSLNERQEILDLTALTRALVHPADRVAALAVLRAPWCGLTLADLYTLCEGDNREHRTLSIQTLIERNAARLSQEAQMRLDRIAHVFNEAARLRGRLTTAQLVERAWRSLGGDAWLDATEEANCRRFFELLDSIELSQKRFGTVDTSQLEENLEALYAEPSPIPASEAHVELLTIHRSKGLEWDVIFVPALHAAPRGGESRMLTWSQLNDTDAGSAPGMLAPIAARGADSNALTSWLKSIQAAREYAERKRLFYVASTRAREELHLFASPKVKQDGNLSVPRRSLLDAAMPAAPLDQTYDEVEGGESISGLEVAASGLGEPMPAMNASSDREIETGQAAGSEASLLPSRPVLKRVPLGFDPRVALSPAHAGGVAAAVPGSRLRRTEGSYSRPEGSLAARSFGNLIHLFLERMAMLRAEGESFIAVLRELPNWTARATIYLRSNGLSRAQAEQMAAAAVESLRKTTEDPKGVWLLSPRANAATELALVSEQESGVASSIRADRVFQGGAEPLLPGEDFLWIIDYKTASCAESELEDFLAEQRSTYAPQLQSYARVLAAARSFPAARVRVGLYFPVLPRLIWWSITEPS